MLRLDRVFWAGLIGIILTLLPGVANIMAGESEQIGSMKMEILEWERLVGNDKLSEDLREYLLSIPGTAELARPIGRRLVVLLSTLVDQERNGLPDILARALEERPALPESVVMPPGMENLVEIEPTLGELLDTVDCPLVLQVQISLIHEPMTDMDKGPDAMGENE
jgi:hypothetical protein